MQFEITQRDGLARIGRLKYAENLIFQTPSIVYVNVPGRYSAPTQAAERTARLRVSSQKDAGPGVLTVSGSSYFEKPEIRMGSSLDPRFRGSPYAVEKGEGDFGFLDDLSSLLLDSTMFVKALGEMKGGSGLMKPLYCSVMGLPHRLAFLVYCGFDLFDSIPLVMAAENGTYLTSTGALDYQSIKDLPCSCPACASGRRGKNELLEHNYNEAENELRLVSHAISQGKLRELVESRVRSDPWLVQNLRLMDLEQYALQEAHASVRGSPFHAGSKESLSRPDIVRWRMRLQERYMRPAGTRILLLIPCSARKPYSLSQSHRRFRDAIDLSGRGSIVHEVIVTSPLGLVPRELELFYPAKDYDIPVTGHWDGDEKKMAEDLVSWLVASQRYDLVISHLGDEREPVNSVLKDFVDTSLGHPGSRESLERLEKTIQGFVPPEEGKGRRSRQLEDMRSLCRFQFGKAGETLCDDATLEGRWPNMKIISRKRQLGMLTGDRGMISLTIDGAAVLAEHGAYCVEIEDFLPKGNLFAVGVESAGKEIRVGDDVAVVHKGDVRAVGVAMMSAVEMNIAERGEAVHIRHVKRV